MTAKILIVNVDDNDGARYAKTRILQSAGFQVLEASNGTDALAMVKSDEPELVLLGTGQTQRFPPAAVRAVLATRGVGLEIMDLGAACRTFNILVQEERKGAAGLFLS